MGSGAVFRPALKAAGLAVLVLLGLLVAGKGSAQPASTRPKVIEALDNVRNLTRPQQDGYATIWEGDKYVQCHALSDQSLSCEAAGAVMQPSLAGLLSPERKRRLTSLGWRLDQSFGAYTQIFPPAVGLDKVADSILASLSQGYDADLTFLEVQTRWVGHQACPPRRGPGQVLAGIVDDSPMAAPTAVQGCAYKPPATATASASGASAPGATAPGTNSVRSSPPPDSGAAAPTMVVVETAAADPEVQEVVTVDEETPREPRARRARRPRASSGRREPRERRSTGKRSSRGGGHSAHHK
jgi:hypothetical protein